MTERLLTLVRHGRTEANAANLLQGRVDNDLDHVGRAQAAALGPALARIAAVDRIVASPLVRARRTAEAIATHLSIAEVEIDERWIELDYGDWDGKPMSAEIGRAHV